MVILQGCIENNFKSNYIMKKETLKTYTSPYLEVCEMVLEAPIASSIGSASNDETGVEDATFDDWGTL